MRQTKTFMVFERFILAPFITGKESSDNLILLFRFPLFVCECQQTIFFIAAAAMLRRVVKSAFTLQKEN